MSHGPTKFLTKGACIYCGEVGAKLTDEHIIPLSLGGVHVIEKASCIPCNNITSKFELDVTRGLWGDARISYNAPTRRKNKRPTNIQLADYEGGRSITIPYSDYPAPIVSYKMSRAVFLTGLPETVDISGDWGFSVVVDDKIDSFERVHGIKCPARFKHVPNSYAKMLAKIGYGQVLSTFDLSEFNPICIPYILGKKDNLSYIVGGSLEIPAQEKEGYRMRTIVIGGAARLILLAEIRIFANLDTPVYHVVVGDINGEAAVSHALGKLDEAMIFRPGIDTELPHWAPLIWPLPKLDK